jgi:hypothetical protein
MPLRPEVLLKTDNATGPPWTVDDPDPKLDRPCFIVRDHNGQALACVYF